MFPTQGNRRLDLGCLSIFVGRWYVSIHDSLLPPPRETGGVRHKSVELRAGPAISRSGKEIGHAARGFIQLNVKFGPGVVHATANSFRAGPI